MNYIAIYSRLIRRSKRRILENDIYTEKHHIIPKCLGGSGNSWNIAILTAEEHYIAHLLLVKIFPDNDKLVFAAKMLATANRYQGTRCNNKLYGWLKRRFNEINTKSRVPRTDEVKAKISNSMKGRQSHRKGVKLSDEHKRKIGLAHKGKQHKKGQVPWNKGKKTGPRQPMSQNTKDALRKLYKGKPKELVICPHCNKEGGKPAMMQWHFDRCKHKDK